MVMYDRNIEAIETEDKGPKFWLSYHLLLYFISIKRK